MIGPMRLRPFGRLRTRVSEIGLGCWQLGGTDWGDVSDEQGLDTLRAAADAGVTFFDTADVYGLGRSETLVGRFLVERKAAHARFMAAGRATHALPASCRCRRTDAAHARTRSAAPVGSPPW